MGLFFGKRDKHEIPHQSFTCPQRWEEMDGDDFVRNCSECQSKVYDLTGLNHKEMRRFIELSEGEVCALVHTDRSGYVVNGKCAKEMRTTLGRIIIKEETEEEKLEQQISIAQKRLERLEKIKEMIIKDSPNNDIQNRSRPSGDSGDI